MISEQELKALKKKNKLVKEAAEAVKVQEKDLVNVIKRFLNEIKEFDKKIKTVKNR